MRITSHLMTDRAVQYMNDNLERLSSQQEKILSGKMFQNASDSPIMASQALSLRSSLRTSQAYLESANSTDDWMAASELAFSDLGGLAKRAMALGNTAIPDTVSKEDRDGISKEVTELINQALETANSDSNGKYIFAGYHINTPPFEIKNGAVVYNGDQGIINRDLGTGQSITVNTPGDAFVSPLISSLVELNTALQNNNPADISAAVTKLSGAAADLSEVRTANGSRQRQVKTMISNLERTQLEMQKSLSEKQNTNMAEMISQFQTQESTYQTVLEVGQRAISVLNLFEVLR
jgi:flagellar hook-associated protein 3 FlgL